MKVKAKSSEFPAFVPYSITINIETPFDHEAIRQLANRNVGFPDILRKEDCGTDVIMAFRALQGGIFQAYQTINQIAREAKDSK